MCVSTSYYQLSYVNFGVNLGMHFLLIILLSYKTLPGKTSIMTKTQDFMYVFQEVMDQYSEFSLVS